jgi:hypothetical protein
MYDPHPASRLEVVRRSPSPGRVGCVPVDLADKAQRRMPELSRRVAIDISRQMKVYKVESAVVSHDDLARSVTANLQTLIDALRTPDALDLSHAQATATRRAGQGVPLADVQRAFRIGIAGLWDLLVDIEDERRSLTATATTFWYLIDQYLEAVADAYRQTTTELVRGQRQHRRALLDALFSGGVVTESAKWDIAELFGIPHDGTFAVIVAETGDVVAAPLGDIEETLDNVGMGSAWQRGSGYHLGIVSIRSLGRLAGLAQILRQRANTRIGVSPAFTGLDKTSWAVHLAHVALASSPRSAGAVVCFEESPLSTLIAAAPEAASHIARQQLMPILDLPVAERDVLLDTVEVWLSNGGSTKRAAGRLYCHANTVRYRLHRVQTHLGVSLTDPVEAAQLIVALRAWRLFGDPAAQPVSPRRLRLVPLDNATAPRP